MQLQPQDDTMFTKALTERTKVELQKEMDRRMKDAQRGIAAAERWAVRAINRADECLAFVEANNLRESEEAWECHVKATAAYNKMLDNYEAGMDEAFLDATEVCIDNLMELFSPYVHDEHHKVLRSALEKFRACVRRLEDAWGGVSDALDDLDEAIHYT